MQPVLFPHLPALYRSSQGALRIRLQMQSMCLRATPCSRINAMVRARHNLPATFQSWFEENHQRTNLPKAKWRRKGGGLVLRFVGVTHHLYCWIDDWQLMLVARYRGSIWDFLFSYDISRDMTTKQQWISESFEPMLVHLDRVLVAGNSLSLRRVGCASTYAVILPHHEFSDSEGEVMRVPVFEDERSP